MATPAYTISNYFLIILNVWGLSGEWGVPRLSKIRNIPVVEPEFVDMVGFREDFKDKDAMVRQGVKILPVNLDQLAAFNGGTHKILVEDSHFVLDNGECNLLFDTL